MNCEKVLEGIIIGGTGGFIAGISIWIIELLRKSILLGIHKSRVLKYLGENTSPNDDKEWLTSRVLASHTNLTEDRIRYICSIHKEIVLDTSENNRDKELWGIKSRVRR
jgi:hypothetical protein